MYGTYEARPLSFGQPAFVVATTSGITNGGQRPLLFVGATTTGDLDFARVGIGTTSPWGGAGLRDQLTVDGRIYSTWRYMGCDMWGTDMSEFLTQDSWNVGTAADMGPTGCAGFGFDEDGAAGLQNSATTSAQIVPPFVRITVPPTAGTGAAIRTTVPVGSATTSPVMEALVKTPGAGYGGDSIQIVGFIGGAVLTSAAASPQDYGIEPNNGAYFVASSTAPQWTAVMRHNGARVSVPTGVATSTGYQRLRVELSSSGATFLINGNVVASTSGALTTPQRSLYPLMSIAASTGGTAGTINRLFDVALVRVWVDDPPTSTADENPAPIQEEYIEPLFNARDSAAIGETRWVDDVSLYKTGALVSNRFSGTSTAVNLSTVAYDSDIAGVVGLTRLRVGDDTGSTVSVATDGRAPVLVSLENGPIHQGDRITTSSHGGIGMRAIRPGHVIGRALEDFNPPAGVGICEPEYGSSMSSGLPNPCYGLVLVDINPELDLAISDTIQDIGTTTAQTTSSLGEVLTELINKAFEKGAELTKAVFGKVIAKVAIIEKMFAREVQTEKLCVGNVCVTEEQFMAMVAASQNPAPLPPPPPQQQQEQENSGPVITVNGGSPTEVSVGTQYIDAGVTVTDDQDQDFVIKLFVDGQEVDVLNIPTGGPATYTITYKVTDSDGNNAEATRTVNVIGEAPAGEPEPIPGPQPEPEPVPEPEPDPQSAPEITPEPPAENPTP
jgi:hypothetical protein